MKNNYSLKGKTVFITGALGQIGRATVLRLLESGAFVHISDAGKKMDAAFARDLKAKGHAAFMYIALDVTSEKAIKEAYKKLKRPVDILINCAGVGVYTPFEKRTEAEIDRVFKVNLGGTILCSKIFSAGMVKRKKGRIINFGSIYGVTTPDSRIYGDSGRNSSEIYGATKAGIIHFTRYIAAYLAPKGILANCISPGGVYRAQAPYFLKRYKAKTPLGRMAEPDDLTGVIAFLCSDEAGYITGQNITVDGGFTIW